jgi:hypothetical protein
MKWIWRKLTALKDVLFSRSFYLVTFDKDENIKWRTSYGIEEDEAVNKLK